jgi:hypothetical protein
MPQDKGKLPPMRHCFYCGEELGRYRDYDRLDTCGKMECLREAQDTVAAERAEAHEELDRERGWS